MWARARAPTSGAEACGRDRRTQPHRTLLLDACSRQCVLALRIVADARDLAFPQNDDLEEARNEPLRTEPLEAPTAELNEHTIAEIDHLARPETIRVGAP